MTTENIVVKLKVSTWRLRFALWILATACKLANRFGTVRMEVIR